MRPLLILVLGAALLGGAESVPASVIADDPAFAAVLAPGTAVEKLADHGTGTFLEGPAWMPGGFLVYSDIPHDRLLRWPGGPAGEVFRAPSRKTNGNALWQGRLLSCEQSAHRLAATGADGAVTSLADAHAGKPLNSPNDLALAPDGAVWFTDPTWGMPPRIQEQAHRGVYRCDPATGAVTEVVADMEQPNGICFSPDHATLYVSETGKTPLIRAFRVVDGKALADGRPFATVDAGVPDGMKVDTEGRLYAGIATGVEVFAADGKRLGLIPVPETTANLCFGGADRRTLYLVVPRGVALNRRSVTAAQHRKS